MRTLTRASLLGLLGALALWAGPTRVDAQTPICEASGVQVSVDFTSGGRHTCRVADNGEIILDVTPEGQPINPSPYYAFRLDAQQRTRLRITLDYGEYEHRYAPKYTHDGVNWRSVPPRMLVVAADEHRATMTLNVEPGLTVVSAQPIETPAAMHAWARATLAPHAFEQVQYGTSIDGAPLIGIAAAKDRA
ncbi:MAG: hypothetical protein R3C16_09915 [Hyphomonadaceae bacterium]